MSTNNFSFENILVVIPDFRFKHDCVGCECEEGCGRDGEYEDELDDWAFDEYIADVQSQLEKIGFESCDRTDDNRNFTGRVIAEFTQEDKYTTRNIEVVIRSGYYDGANIDYTIVDDSGFNCTKAQDKQFNSKIRQLEKILRKNGTELLKVGQFSNGEAVYKLKK